jgi:prophage antirepressor-like protein
MIDGRDREGLHVEQCAKGELSVGVVAIDDQPWFVLSTLVGLGRSAAQIEAKVPPRDKVERVVSWPEGQKRPTSLLSELGLYRVLLSSKNPAADDLAGWIFDEVAPSVRKAGRFRVFHEARRLGVHLDYTPEQWEWLRLNPQYIDIIPFALSGFTARKITQILGYNTSIGITVRKQVQILKKHGLLPPDVMTRRGHLAHVLSEEAHAQYAQKLKGETEKV